MSKDMIDIIKQQLHEAIIKVANDNGFRLAENLSPFVQIRTDSAGDGRLSLEVSVDVFNNIK